jgi:hypothetical protein
VRHNQEPPSFDLADMGRASGSSSSPKFDFAVAAIVILVYCAVYFIVRPLTDAPVGDSWVYEHAVTHFNRTGAVQFPGFTQAIPLAQVLYGVAWSRLFGETSPALDLSTTLLGMLGSLLFYGLARRCGAAGWLAALATALIAFNPCYLFLSFSFMTEVPFLVTILASYLAFTYANNGTDPHRGWLWLSGAAAAVGFAIRPFAGATITGEAAALLLDNHDGSGARWRPKMRSTLPLLTALTVCAAFWTWFTIINPGPWMLEYDEQRLRTYFTFIPLRSYLTAGLLEPAVYLGIVLSPLAILHSIRHWRRCTMLASAILASSITIIRFGQEPIWDLERITCFGGSHGALVLSGPQQHDFSVNLGWLLLILGAVGFAGIFNAWCVAIQNSKPMLWAVLFSGIIYWLAIPLLWLFADRYDLLLLPAACLPLALAPLPRRSVTVIFGTLMTAILAFASVGGLVSYHRTMQMIVTETEALVRQGIPRSQIDAGYSLNGRDLYVYPVRGRETARDEPPIPLIIGSPVAPYVISTSPMPDNTIWRRFSVCGPLGFGLRPLFILRTNTRPILTPP